MRKVVVSFGSNFFIFCVSVSCGKGRSRIRYVKYIFGRDKKFYV